MNSVTWGAGRFVAVGDNGAIGTSTDGAVWNGRLLGGNHLNGITYGAGQYVAVGDYGTVVTSPDGATWTARASGVGETLYGITYGRSKYLASTYWPSCTILTSNDGVAWSQRTISACTYLENVVSAGAWFFAFGSGNAIWTSPDGAIWTRRYSGLDSYSSLYDVAYGAGKYVAVGGSGAIVTSTDGISWTVRQSGTTMWLEGVVYTGQAFVVVGEYGEALTSPDGVGWTSRPTGTSRDFHAVAFDGSHAVAVGDDGTIIRSTCSAGPPVADFVWFPQTPVTGQSVSFTDVSSGAPTSWFWNFGDGSTSTQQNPKHTFGLAASYTASLSATNLYGTTHVSKQIAIGVTIFSDDFEGTFPGSWQLTGNALTGWGKVTCAGTVAWCAAGGSSPQPPCSQYVGNMNTWMVYGPFSLADATEASAEFDAWYDTETYNPSTQKGDRFWWVISIDGTHYSGFPTSGTSGDWTHKEFNFKDVTSFATVGNATVWFAFAFQSDSSVQGGGAYVHNVVIKKTVPVTPGATPTPIVTPTPTPTPTLTPTPIPPTPTRTPTPVHRVRRHLNPAGP
jgi:PKD repeat protein